MKCLNSWPVTPADGNTLAMEMIVESHNHKNPSHPRQGMRDIIIDLVEGLTLGAAHQIGEH